MRVNDKPGDLKAGGWHAACRQGRKGKGVGWAQREAPTCCEMCGLMARAYLM